MDISSDGLPKCWVPWVMEDLKLWVPQVIGALCYGYPRLWGPQVMGCPSDGYPRLWVPYMKDIPWVMGTMDDGCPRLWVPWNV